MSSPLPYWVRLAVVNNYFQGQTKSLPPKINGAIITPMDAMIEDVVRDALRTAIEELERILHWAPRPYEQTVTALSKAKAALRLLEEK